MRWTRLGSMLARVAAVWILMGAHARALDLKWSWLNPTPEAGARFGTSVAIDGDVVAVGAPQDASPVNNEGAVHLFNAQSGDFLRTIDNPLAVAGTGFGSWVDLSGNTLAVGAPGDDTGAMNSGSVFLFNASTGANVGRLRKVSPVAEDNLGFRVAISGDRVLVGVPNDDGFFLPVAERGSAVLFDLAGNILFTFFEPSAAAQNFFGSAVAIDANRLVISAPFDDFGSPDAGAVYVYDATSFALLRTIQNPAPSDRATFGRAVDISGTNLLVGVPSLQHPGTPAIGGAYLMSSETGSVIQLYDNPAPTVNDSYGASVAISGSRLLIGAVGDDADGLDDGLVYSYEAPSTEVVQTFHKPVLSAASESFGVSVAVQEARVVIGANGGNDGALNSGAAYYFTTGGRSRGDFDDSGCTNLGDFLFLLDNWQMVVDGDLIELTEFLNLIDNWQMGENC